MFAWLKRKRPPAHPAGALRELLFGDVPAPDWAVHGIGEPWTTFRAAAQARDAGDRAAARAAFSRVLATSGLESRHYLQAWSGLRELGVSPPEAEAARVYGVVVEMPVAGGLDTLAAYEDKSARYFNHGGGAILWDMPGRDATVDAAVQKLVAEGGALAATVGTWSGARPPLPPDQARISLLTPGGLRFGQGKAVLLSRDPRAAAVLDAALALMLALTDRASAG